MLKICRPSVEHIFNIHNPVGLKFLTRLRLCLSHLHCHRFTQKFSNCINPCVHAVRKLNRCSIFFLLCHYFTNNFSTLLDKLAGVDWNILTLSDDEIGEVLPYSSSKYNMNQDCDILNAAINFILKSKSNFSSLLL